MLDNVENLRRILRGERPERIPVESFFDPRYGEGAYTLVGFRGHQPPREGGRDIWGGAWRGSDTWLPYQLTSPVSSLEAALHLPFPNPDAPERWIETRATISGLQGRALPIAWQTAGIWERLWILVGMENALEGLLLEPELVEMVLDRVLDWQLHVAQQFIEAGVEAGRISDDYGAQRELLMSPRVWRRFIKPRIACLAEFYHAHKLPVILHSCGNLTRIIDDLIEIGFDALNIQTNANDLLAYRARFGDRFCIWGGVSTQAVLAQGTPEEVRKAVEWAVSMLGREGRLILEPDQFIKVPEENLRAYFEEGKRLQQLS